MMEYNLEYLEELAAGDNNFLLSMVQDFIHQTPDTLVQIAKSISLADYALLYQLVHRFIPTLEYMGVEELVRKYRDIEQFAKAKAEIDLIKKHFEQAQADTYIIIEKLKHDFNQ
ncbi:MAG: hypothetical protein ACP5PZ_01750 [Bacteroidales bacterium]